MDKELDMLFDQLNDSLSATMSVAEVKSLVKAAPAPGGPGLSFGGFSLNGLIMFSTLLIISATIATVIFLPPSPNPSSITADTVVSHPEDSAPTVEFLPQAPETIQPLDSPPPRKEPSMQHEVQQSPPTPPLPAPNPVTILAAAAPPLAPTFPANAGSMGVPPSLFPASSLPRNDDASLFAPSAKPTPIFTPILSPVSTDTALIWQENVQEFVEHHFVIRSASTKTDVDSVRNTISDMGIRVKMTAKWNAKKLTKLFFDIKKNGQRIRYASNPLSRVEIILVMNRKGKLVSFDLADDNLEQEPIDLLEDHGD